MFTDHAPERACIRCANGFPFEHDCGVPMYQWRITDIGMADDPTHIRGGPKHIAWVDIIDVFHGPI